jgi:hypothetical protein
MLLETYKKTKLKNYTRLRSYWGKKNHKRRTGQVLGFIPASSDTVETEGRQMKQCWMVYIKKKKSKILKILGPFQNGLSHRAGRGLSFSPVAGIGTTPTPQPQARVPPPLWFRGEWHTRWRERVWESPNSDEGTYTVVLFIYMYFLGYALQYLP